MVEIVYKLNDEYFTVGDIVQVFVKNPFNDEDIREVTGRLVRSLLNTEIQLDVSTRYNSKMEEIDIKDIVKINKI